MGFGLWYIVHINLIPMKLSGRLTVEELWRISFMSAEGARRKPNLSGKRTEENLLFLQASVGMSVAGVWLHSFFVQHIK